MQNRVLVIDDSPIVYKMVKRALEPCGYEIIGHAQNGAIGVEMAMELKPDVITLDVTMPVMDGLQAARILYEKNPDIKIILMSAMSDEDLINEAKEIGIKYFIEKPIEAAILFKEVQRVLGQKMEG